MSAGSRSGVHCSRRNSRPSACGEAPRGQRLAEPGYVLEQHVPAGQDRGQRGPQRPPHADDHRADLVEDLLAEPDTSRMGSGSTFVIGAVAWDSVTKRLLGVSRSTRRLLGRTRRSWAASSGGIQGGQRRRSELARQAASSPAASRSSPRRASRRRRGCAAGHRAISTASSALHRPGEPGDVSAGADVPLLLGRGCQRGVDGPTSSRRAPTATTGTAASTIALGSGNARSQTPSAPRATTASAATSRVRPSPVA